MANIALLIKALPLISKIGDKVMGWLRKDPKTFKLKLIFVGVMTTVFTILAAVLGEVNLGIGVDAVVEICKEINC